MDKVEKQRLIFIKDQEITGDTISEDIICEKALEIYNDLKIKLLLRLHKSTLYDFLWEISFQFSNKSVVE